MTLRITVAALLLAGLAAAQTSRPKPYVTADLVNLTALLPAPAEKGTPAWQAEMAEVHRLEATRTKAQVARAKADDRDETMFAFRDVLGEKFVASALPLTAALSARVHANEGEVVNPAKQYFHRVRPFNVDSTLHPVCPTKPDVNDYGYPSGHSSSGWLEALVLIQIVPEKRNEILARAADYAHNRVVCGVHYPADTEAAREVAYAVLPLMMNNAEFQRDLAAAKAETRKLLGL
jgi:acid phosphatase (class A)